MTLIVQLFLHAACASAACVLVGYLLRTRSQDVLRFMVLGAVFAVAAPLAAELYGVEMAMGNHPGGLENAALVAFTGGCLIASGVSFARILSAPRTVVATARKARLSV